MEDETTIKTELSGVRSGCCQRKLLKMLLSWDKSFQIWMHFKWNAQRVPGKQQQQKSNLNLDPHTLYAFFEKWNLQWCIYTADENVSDLS